MRPVNGEPLNREPAVMVFNIKSMIGWIMKGKLKQVMTTCTLIAVASVFFAAPGLAQLPASPHVHSGQGHAGCLPRARS